MQVKDIMTKNPACCTPDTNLQRRRAAHGGARLRGESGGPE